MEYEKIKEWLDIRVDCIEKQMQNLHFNNHIRMSRPDSYVFLAGVDEVADTMGLELVEELSNDTEYPYHYYFMYRGIKFMDFLEERLERFVEEGEKDVRV